MKTIRLYPLQGEERDSSDEEWTNAYATMDPVAQLGWRNRRAGVEGPARQLMRDILEAADAVHSEAMSELLGSRSSSDEEPGEDDAAVVESPRPAAPSNRRPSASVEVDQEGVL